MADMKEVLMKFLAIQGVQAAMIVGRDGLLIDGVSLDDSDLEAMSAISLTGSSMAEAMGQEMMTGGLHVAIMEYDKGIVALEPLNEYSLFVALSNETTSLGRIRLEVKKHRDELARSVTEA